MLSLCVRLRIRLRQMREGVKARLSQGSLIGLSTSVTIGLPREGVEQIQTAVGKACRVLLQVE